MENEKNGNIIKWRHAVLIVIVLVVIFGVMVRLMTLQIVSGEEYQSLLSEGYSVNKKIEAARGDIVDRYGRSLAVNRVCYDITFDKNNIVKNSENSVILELIGILEENGEDWIDSLPISEQAPWEYTGCCVPPEGALRA